jgi:hypothetical protein
MKKFLLGTLIVFGSLFTLSSGAAAQNGVVKMHLPQEFVAGGKTFPAGTYTAFEGPSQTGLVLTLRSDDGTTFVLSTTRDGDFPGKASVRLERVGNVYYLSQIVTPLGTYSFAVPQGLTRIAKAKSQDSTAAGGTGK